MAPTLEHMVPTLAQAPGELAGAGLEIDLRWPGSGNSRALGARVTVHAGETRLMRQVQSGNGYLSGEPARLHVGLPAGHAVDRIEIVWPDGVVSEIGATSAGVHLHVTRAGSQ